MENLVTLLNSHTFCHFIDIFPYFDIKVTFTLHFASKYLFWSQCCFKMNIFCIKLKLSCEMYISISMYLVFGLYKLNL